MSSREKLSIEAKDVRAQAADWLIERRDCENWNETTQADFQAWIDQSPAHRIAYLRLEATWKRADRLAAISPADRPSVKKSFSARILRAAIGLVVIIAAGIEIATFLSMPSERTYATNIGDRKTIALDDGSKIELNSETALRTLVSGKQRTVWIDKGEAYFQIRHDAARPFVVFAGNGRVTDLGTKFSIRRDADSVEISLVEGRARFDAIGGQSQGRSAELVSGDQVLATSASISKTRADSDELSRRLSWRKGVLIFDNLALSDVAASFNRYNREKLVIAGTDVGRLTIVGTFRTDGVGRFSRIAHDILGLQITHQSNEIIISR